MLVVLAAIKLANEVVEITPFTLDVIIEVAVAKLSKFELTKVEVETIPFTDEVAMLSPVVKVLLEITLVVALTPFTVVVNTFPEREVVSELMMFVKSVETPLTIEAKVLVVVERELELIKLVVVVEITPLTFEVKVKLLVVVAIDNTLDVTAVLVAITPLTLVVITLPSVEIPLLLMMLKVVVAKTPLVVLLKVIVFVLLALLKVLVVLAAKSDDSEVVAITPLMFVVNTPVLVAKLEELPLMILAVVVEMIPLTLVVQV
jgi:hypothetical protein